MMTQLAIKGHVDRGEEVIKILELLGGKNPNYNVGKYINYIYFINNNGYIEATNNPLTMLDFTVLTLEEVEALMPYKIGDKVLYEDEICEITGMRWHKHLEKIVYDAKGEKCTLFNIFEPDKFIPVIKQEIAHAAIRLIEEETIKDMDEKDKAKAPDLKGEDYSGKRLGYKIPDGYEFDTVYNGKIILKSIKPQYPTTFKECCNIVKASPYVKLVYDKSNGQTHSHDKDNLQIYENLRKLKICRDAYWKIAGEQMGLDKPWEPDWETGLNKFCLANWGNQIIRCIRASATAILAFSTEEMRDMFHENFKDLIEECKELL